MLQGKACGCQSQNRRVERYRHGPGWQRALFGLYSVLFALVLPLICWGAYASPGHPHRIPHFVFVPPVVAGSGPAAPAAHHRHDASSTQMDGSATQDQPKGRASLSLMLFSILTFVVLGAWSLARLDRRYGMLLHLPPFARSVTLPILLPPPRSVALAS